jgi:hypothetical protein
VADERARVDVADDGDAMAFEIGLRSFARPPVGSEKGKFADDQAFDERLGRFLIIEIGADITDVGIGQADDLPGVAGVGENFLISGEAGIKNDFAATAGASTRGAAVKDSSVL